MIRPRFLNRAVLEDRTDRTWRLMTPLRYVSALHRARLIVPAGFITDLASVPRWPFVFLFFGDVTRGPAIVHDYLYQTHLVSKDHADLIFEEAMAADGVAGWRHRAMTAAVELLGARAYRTGPARYQVLNVEPRR